MPNQYERMLQNYLVCNRGKNLDRIDSGLRFIENEHKFPGGRIDILAENAKELVGIELKAATYSTREVCAQLLNYFNYLEPLNGKIYFVAPKIKYGIYSTFKHKYISGNFKLFEYKYSSQNYSFVEMNPRMLDDKRQISLLSPKPDLLSTSIKKYALIFAKNRNDRKLIEKIMDSLDADNCPLESAAEIALNILSRKFPLGETFKILRMINGIKTQ